MARLNNARFSPRRTTWFVLLFCLAGSSVVQIAQYSLALRGVAGVLVVLVIWRQTRSKTVPQRPTVDSRGLVLLSVGQIGFVASATIPHGMTGLFFGYLAALLLFLISSLGFITYCAPRNAEVGLVRGLKVVLSLSLVLGLVWPSVAVYQSRLRGVFENANLLGFVAAVALFFFVCRSERVGIKSAIALACLLLSGSRGGLLFIVVAIAYLACAGHKRSIRLAYFTAVAVVTNMLIHAVPLLNVSVFRVENSRFGGNQLALSVLRSFSLFGFGYNLAPIRVAGSPSGALVQGGVVGFSFLMLSYIALAMMWRRADIYGRAFIAAAAAHSLVEGWLLSLSGPIMVIFVVGLSSCERREGLDRCVRRTGEVPSGRPSVRRPSTTVRATSEIGYL